MKARVRLALFSLASTTVLLLTLAWLVSAQTVFPTATSARTSTESFIFPVPSWQAWLESGPVSGAVIPVVNIRRDLSSGQLPSGGAHSAGVSQIIWGSATPNTTLVITLTRPGEFGVVRSVTSDQGGSFVVSMDRLIADGDVVQVATGTTVKTIQVPILSYQADPATRIITGAAPSNITIVTPGAPHSLQVAIAGSTRQATTSAAGEYRADFTASPYIAGLLGSICYTTPAGDRIYKPIFVADPLVRGKLGDWWADTILGQPAFSQVTPNEVTGNRLFNPGGVYVDRSVQPNRVYVWDGGNSRILGLSHLGTCPVGARSGENCTTDSDCLGVTCEIEETKGADIILGQLSLSSSVCNGDSGYQIYPDVPMAGATTLCGLREEQLSIGEGGSGVTMAADTEGNLYVPDFFNNRVLRYDSPFTTDTSADYVWGQADFSGTTCNRGAGLHSRTDAKSLCLAQPPGVGPIAAGVSLDAAGNLWVADTENNRVLRFPIDSAHGRPAFEADLVLGQPDFSTSAFGTGLNQMARPTSAALDGRGTLYISDSLNRRVLVFDPPVVNGMYASRSIRSDFNDPKGVEVDLAGGVWVADTDRLVHFTAAGTQDTVISVALGTGNFGIDRDGNILAAGWYSQGGRRYVAPSYAEYDSFLRHVWSGNQTGPRATVAGVGFEVAAGQLIYSDWNRMLFWNNL